MSLKGTLFTEEEFNFTKTLLSNGVTYKQAVALKLYTRSSATWHKVARMSSWKDYTDANNEHRLNGIKIAQDKAALKQGMTNGAIVKSDILTEGNVLLENTILLQSINKLQVSIDKLNDKLSTFGQNEKTLMEKVFGRVQ